MMMLAPVPTPHGLLTLRQAGEALALEPERGTRLEKAFMRGSGHGLLCLGADEVGTALPPVLSYCGNLGRAMWPRSAHFLVLPKVLPSSACPFPKKRIGPDRRGRSAHNAAPCAHVGGASHGTHDTTVRASPSR
jgi:hypothetical protein